MVRKQMAGASIDAATAKYGSEKSGNRREAQVASRRLGLTVRCVALFMTIMAVLAICGCSGKADSPSSSQETASVASESESVWLDESIELGDRTEFGGLSFCIPKDWVAEDADNGGMYYFREDDRSSIIHVLGTDFRVPDGKDREALDEILGGVLGEDNPRPADLETDYFEVDKYPAMRATYTNAMNGQQYSFRFEAVLHDGQASLFLAGCPVSRTAHDAVLAECVNSIGLAADSGAKQEPASGAKAAEETETKSKDATSEKAAEPPAENDDKINADKFNAIKQGMSYEEVVGIIGSEGELNSSSSVAGIDTESYTWKSDGWGIATIMFQDGVVVNKTQVGVGSDDGVKVNMDMFNQIENGMTYEQVVEILGGEGQLLSETELAGITMAIYTWDGESLFSTCQVTFQNGAVSSKSQYGLK